MPDSLRLIAPLLIGSGGGFDFTGLGLVALAIIGLTILMLSTFRRTQRSRNSSGPRVRHQYEAKKDIASARQDAERVTLELDRFAREIMGQLDTRFAKLQEVIRQADERIAQMASLAGPPNDTPADNPRDFAAGRPADGRRNDAARVRDHVGADGGASSTAASEAAAFLDPTARRQVEAAAVVYRLADDGLDAQAIAERIGRPSGEVELMLALRRVKSQSTANVPMVTDSVRL